MALDKTNLVTFKKGLESALPKSGVVADAFYLATDTHRLYVGVDSTHTALLNSAVKVYDTLSDLTGDKQYKPEKGDIAFVVNDNSNHLLNALVMHNGTTWVQINAPFDDTEIKGLIAAAQSAATAAQNAADKAQATADAAMPKTGDTFTGKAYGVTPDTTDGDKKALVTREYVDKAVSGLTDGSYATKEYVDDEVNKLDGKISTANSAIQEVKETADAAMPKAGGNFTGDVTIQNVAVATTTDVDNAKTAIIGGATAQTLKAIEDAHKTDVATINSKFDQIQGKVDSLANVMTFVGTTTTVLPEGAGEQGRITVGTNTNYIPDIGDVVIDPNGEEFVWTDSKWEQFGSASASTAAITALENKIKTNTEAIESNDKDITELQTADSTLNTKIDGVSAVAAAAATKTDFEQYKTDNDAEVKKLKDAVNNETTGLSATYALASNAATKTALSDEVTARTNAVNDIVEQLTWGSF